MTSERTDNEWPVDDRIFRTNLECDLTKIRKKKKKKKKDVERIVGNLGGELASLTGFLKGPKRVCFGMDARKTCP